jgi:hypothetical protein
MFLQSMENGKLKTERELRLEELLISARAIAERKGEGTAWERFSNSIAKEGIGSVTARTYRILPSDKEFPTAQDVEVPETQCQVCKEPMTQTEYLLQICPKCEAR